MDYSKELQKIEDFVRSEYYREAARNCGAILESVLKDIYGKIRANAPLAVSTKLIEVEGKLSKGKSGFQDFMLGQLVGLYREAKVFDQVEPVLHFGCKLSKRLPLDELADIRNKCTHDHEYTPNLEELSFFLSNLKVLLSEFGYLPVRIDVPPPPNRSSEGLQNNELTEIRRQMVTAKSQWDLEEALYKVNHFLHEHPKNPEAQRLESQITQAIRRGRQAYQASYPAPQSSMPERAMGLSMWWLIGAVIGLLLIGFLIILWVR